MNNNEWQLIIKKLENELKQKVYQFPNFSYVPSSVYKRQTESH